MKALLRERRKSKESKVSSETSEDGEEPQYDDGPESSSLSSSSREPLSIKSQRRSRLKTKLYLCVPSPKANPSDTDTPSKIQVTLQRLGMKTQQHMKELSIVLNVPRDSISRPPSHHLNEVVNTPNKLGPPTASPHPEVEVQAAKAPEAPRGHRGRSSWGNRDHRGPRGPRDRRIPRVRRYRRGPPRPQKQPRPKLLRPQRPLPLGQHCNVEPRRLNILGPKRPKPYSAAVADPADVAEATGAKAAMVS